MHIPQEYFLPFLITNIISVLLVLVCSKWYGIGKSIFGIIFLTAGVINIFTAIKNPGSYLEYGKTATLFFYRDFIYGGFRDHIMLIVIFIAIGQLFISLFMFSKGFLLSWGITGAIIFFALISPLGFGSAFPAPLIMLIALLILNARRKKKLRHLAG
jgi:hypothetical protein